jgi:hypothetical protein
MVLSADKVLKPENNVIFHVFTNQAAFCQSVQNELKNTTVRIHEIDNLIWPHATLDRYSLISKFQSEIVEDIVMHLDADMYIHQNFLTPLRQLKLNEDVSLVSHPGYWRDSREYFHNGSMIHSLKDLARIIWCGGIGAWETNQISMAFVPRRLRKNYVCGGVWFGKRNAIIELCEKLALAIDKDLENNFIARWHDESHINKWATEHQFNLLDPEFCYSASYRNLVGINMYIEAVTKNPIINESKRNN